jgi:shikimate kinase
MLSLIISEAGGAEVGARGGSRTMANITLIGMPGSGKSTLGARLAQRLGYRFIDGDAIIESSGKRLQEIIDRDGEEEFLRIEEAELLKLAGQGQVFAPGGSCVLSPRAMDHLRGLSLVVFLDLSLPLLETRLGTDAMTRRGIVGLRWMDLAQLYEIRRPLYLRYAHIRVSLDARPIPECLEIVLALIQARGSGYDGKG